MVAADSLSNRVENIVRIDEVVKWAIGVGKMKLSDVFWVYMMALAGIWMNNGILKKRRLDWRRMKFLIMWYEKKWKNFIIY